MKHPISSKVLIAGAALALLVVVAARGGHGGAHHDPMAHLHAALVQLGLGDEQVQRVHRVVTDRHAEVESAHQRFAAEHGRVLRQVFAAELNEDAIRAASARFAKAQLALALEMARLQVAVRAELTPEQRAALDAMVASHAVE